jgi:hypothetical protein
VVLVGTDLGKVYLRGTTGGLIDVTSCVSGGINVNCLPLAKSKTAGRPLVTATAVRTDTSGAVEAWVAFGTQSSPGRIWYSPDITATGRTWLPLDAAASLPDQTAGMAVHALALDPHNPRLLYAGTDFGVDVCTGCSGASPTPRWFVAGSGLPQVAVVKLTLSTQGSRLLASTHGRGVWALPLP